MTAKLRFREKEEMKELCDNCNKLSEKMRDKFGLIEKYTKELEKNRENPEPLKKIQDILNALELKAETIEVHTSYLKTDEFKGNSNQSD